MLTSESLEPAESPGGDGSKTRTAAVATEVRDLASKADGQGAVAVNCCNDGNRGGKLLAPSQAAQAW